MEQIAAMADFLTAVSTKKTTAKPAIEKIKDLSIQDAVPVDSAQTALKALKDQPTHETVTNVLKYLNGPDASLVISEPVYASIAYELVNNTIPNYWRVLKRRSKDAHALTSILRNPTGLGHLLTRLRSLIADSRQNNTAESTHAVPEHLEDTLDVLDRTLRGDDVSFLVWKEIQGFAKNDIQKKLMWKEYLAQVASGRVLSIKAEAEDVLKGKGIERSFSSGTDYASWLGRNVSYALTTGEKSETFTAALTDLGSKILSLGYTGETASLGSMASANPSSRPAHFHHAGHCHRAGPCESTYKPHSQTEGFRTKEVPECCHRLPH